MKFLIIEEYHQLVPGEMMLSFFTLIFILIFTFSFSQNIYAKCSRPIIVPASPLGKMLITDNPEGEVSGIFAEVLREKGPKFGCQFIFPVMPRARAEHQMSMNEADLLVGSIKVSSRDAWAAEFVPMFRSNWFLISVGVRNPPEFIQNIIDHPDLTLYVVRGYNYGVEYMDMLEKLEKKKKVIYVAEPEKIVRMMTKERVTYTFMPTVTFVGAMEKIGAKKSLTPKLTYTQIKDLPEAVNGFYLSKRLSAQDRATLKTLAIEIRNEKLIFQRLGQIYSPEEMKSNSPLKK